MAEISLSRDEITHQWFAEKVTYYFGEARNRVTFARPLPLEKAFTAEFCTEIARYLPETFEQRVHVESNGVVEIANLVLGGIRVLSQRPMHGIQRVVVRFRQAVGALQALLRPDYRTETVPSAALPDTAANALLSLLHPCLELADIDRSVLADEMIVDQLASRLDRLSEKKEELSFFAYLMRRYIEHAAAANQDKPIAGPAGRALPGGA